MLTLIEGGDIFAPEPLGRQSILIAAGKILHIGPVDPAALRPFDVTRIPADNALITPGLIDPHNHLLGAGGEQGFASRMPEVSFDQLAAAGVTTAVGILGSDAITRRLEALHGKVSELNAKGITAYMYTGAMEVPPPTLTGSIHSDLVLMHHVIGVGEIAVSDHRSTAPTTDELARIAAQAHLGGLTAGKAGVTHFHLGDRPTGLAPLLNLLDKTDLPIDALYPTHVTRHPKLLIQAVNFARRGGYVDTDTVEDDTWKHLPKYLTDGGPLDRWTFSSDAHTTGASVHRLLSTFQSLARESSLNLTDALMPFTANTARVLKLKHKGRLVKGADADLLILDPKSFALRHTLAIGKIIFSSAPTESP